MSKRWIVAVLLTVSFALAAPPDPVAVVKKKDSELRAMLQAQRKSPTPERTQQLKVLINSLFDFEELARRAIPSRTWKEASEEQKSRFVAEFRRMVENQSVKQLDAYTSDSSRYEPPVINGEKGEVTARVWNKKQMAVLVYKMNYVNGQWRAWDLVIDDLSTMRNYRDQFSKILKEKSFEQLITTIKEKADEP